MIINLDLELYNVTDLPYNTHSFLKHISINVKLSCWRWMCLLDVCRCCVSGLCVNPPVDGVLPDFLLGEESHSLQLLQLRDPLLDPLLNHLRHLVAVSALTRYFTMLMSETATLLWDRRAEATRLLRGSTHGWKLLSEAFPVPSANGYRRETRAERTSYSGCADTFRIKLSV